MKGNIFKSVLACAALVCAVATYANTPVEVVALFKDRAVVKTIAGREMLKVGESSKDGVVLISADPHGAKVRYNGEIYDLTLSARVGTSFAKAEASSVRIARDELGQYRVRGAINDQFVNFLVDTGASVIALSERQARSLGLAYTRGERGMVQTAQGNSGAFFLNVDKVTIGGINVRGVRATVIDGNFPVDVLLGMSFLSQVRLRDDEGVLTLTAKY